mmetsp:Transcript_125289/g.187139  ORF Transcript_125289/g.187139 Transcript_125289/m.187139 type:complete len:129 (+) Transcript_125289:81-467(+)
MGYTHYWEQQESFSDEQWMTLVDAIKFMVEEYKFDPERLEINNESSYIALEVYETFFLKKTAIQGEFQFCKTAGADGDTIVVAMLMAAAMICDSFSWSSDGENFVSEEKFFQLWVNRLSGKSVKSANK